MGRGGTCNAGGSRDLGPRKAATAALSFARESVWAGKTLTRSRATSVHPFHPPKKRNSSGDSTALHNCSPIASGHPYIRRFSTSLHVITPEPKKTRPPKQMHYGTVRVLGKKRNASRRPINGMLPFWLRSCTIASFFII